MPAITMDSTSAIPPTESAEYWADTIRQNLQIARYSIDENSDDEHAQTRIDETIMEAPRRGTTRRELASQVAAKLYPDHPPDSLAPIIQYEKDIVSLRALVQEHRRSAVSKATKENESHNFAKRIQKQGPWDPVKDPLPLTGASSLPMPVEVSDKESLAPFFAHLRDNGTHQVSENGEGSAGIEPYYNVELIEFEKGVLYSDGRVDLCKMATGPRNIGDLMNSLKPNTSSKHFLLGNNIIGPVGADSIASFIEEFPDRFETWYLAGNCIDAASFGRLVNSMVKSPVITNVWLKRNPLGRDAAKDVFRLITQSPNLRTLDLDQTELGDEGVAELFTLLTNHSKPHKLRHIYLNAVGISTQACSQISLYLASPSCALTSLFISNNPIGPALATLAPGLAANSTLERLSLQSCGLSDASTTPLLRALKNHPLKTLDLGQSYATEDLGTRYNWLSDAQPLIDLVTTTPSLQYLNLSSTPMPQEALNSLLAAVAKSNTLLSFHAKSLVRGDPAAVHAGQEGKRLQRLVNRRLSQNVWEKLGVHYDRFNAELKRFLVSPEDVRFIDSVYRNRDAGRARRGEGRLEKWWGEGDDTLKMIGDGMVE